MNINTNNISLTTLREELAKATNHFGFEERLLTGTLDTTNEWTETSANTGALSAFGSIAMKMTTGATNASIITETKNQMFPTGLVGTGITDSFSKLVVEFSVAFTDVANIDNSTFIMGMFNTMTSTRATNSVAGFVFVGDVLNAFTDKSGVEVLTDIGASCTITDFNLFRMEYNGPYWKFYVNGVLVATHAANVAAGFFGIYLKNDAAAEAYLYIRGIRAWLEDT